MWCHRDSMCQRAPVTPPTHLNWRLQSKNKHSLSGGICAHFIINNCQWVCRRHEWARNIPANVRTPAKHIASCASMPINKFSRARGWFKLTEKTANPSSVVKLIIYIGPHWYQTTKSNFWKLSCIKGFNGPLIKTC